MSEILDESGIEDDHHGDSSKENESDSDSVPDLPNYDGIVNL